MASPLDAYIESLASGGATPAAAPVAPAAPAAPGLRARAGTFARGLGAKLVRGGLAAAPVVGAAGAALDTPENVSRVAANTGLDYDTFGGRVGANVLNWLSKTGDVATFGAASTIGDKISRMLSGQPFFEPYSARPAAPAPAAATPAAMSAMDNPLVDAQMFSARAPVTIDGATGAVVPPAPFTSADIDGTRVPAPGFGAFRRTTPGNEGDVVNLGSSAASGSGVGAVQGAGAVSRRYVPKTFAGLATQAGGELALMGNRAKLNAARDKMLLDYQSRIDAANIGARGTVDAAALRAAAAASPQFTVPLNAMPDKTGAFPMAQTRGLGAGTARMVTPTRSMSLAAGIESAKRNNKYQSDEQVRRDLKAMGYEVTD